MKGKMIVVTHKDYGIPEDEVYFPICVGNEIPVLTDKFQPDNAGENISDKNATYCELTAIYWAWKNLKDMDYIGVAHYRRHFSMYKNACTLDKAVRGNAIEAIFKNEGIHTIITTPKRVYPHSIEKHYISSRKGYEKIHKKDVERLRKAIHRLAPDYDDYADCVLRGHSAHMLNMFIMNAENFNNYCTWLFPIIDQVVEWNSDREDQRRYAGALSEFCLDIWIKKNNFKIKELSLLETEKKSFHTKLSGYLKRKMFGK